MIAGLRGTTTGTAVYPVSVDVIVMDAVVGVA
jgi:hypothetical protein